MSISSVTFSDMGKDFAVPNCLGCNQYNSEIINSKDFITYISINEYLIHCAYSFNTMFCTNDPT